MVIFVGAVAVDFPQKVDSVVISPQSAFLFVKQDLKVKGSIEVEISNVPVSSVESVRIGVRDGILANVGFKTRELPYDLEAYNDLEGKVKSLEKLSSYIRAQISEVEYYINLLNASLDGIRNGKGDNINDYLRLSTKLSSYHIKRDSLLKVLRDTDAKLDSLKKLMSGLLTKQGVITLYIENANNPTIDMVIFYPSGSLVWKPEYTVEYRSGGDMKISALAKFVSNIPRKISAKRVIITNIAPSFSPPLHATWYITDRQYFVYPKGLRLSIKSAGVEPEAQGLAEESESEVKIIETTFTSISTRFVINKEITFDRLKPAIAELFEKTYKVDELVSIYPEFSEKAYISVVFKPDIDLPSGDMKVFLNGEFSADYRYEGAQRDEEDTLFLGFDPFITGNVKILDQNRTDIRGKDKTVLTREKRVYGITITNNRKENVELILFVRKPFSSGNVNIVDFGTEPEAEKDLGNGLLMWKINLKSKESFTVKRSITITYPKGSYVNW